jgi:glucuronoarabinoxylan endo-1,4-beta-xylanase
VYWCLVGENKAAGSANGESLMDGGRPTGKYFASKQFYRWIRPGAHRIAAGPDNQDGVCVSAYVHAPKALTIVLINNADAQRTVRLKLKHLAAGRLHAWRSSQADCCAAQPDITVSDGAARLTMPAQSVVTLTTYAEKDVALHAVAH